MVAGRGVKKFRVNKYALRINNNNNKKKKTQSLVNFLGVQSSNKLKFNSLFFQKARNIFPKG